MVVLLLSAEAFGQSNMPACQGSVVAKWHNCFGTYTYPSGSKYVGEFQDGDFNGQGTLIHPDGSKYVGEYKDNRKNGQGTYTWLDGTKYVGEFQNGDFNGQGTYTFPSGAKYIGEFKDDKRNGLGILYLPNGSISQTGIWENSNLVTSKYVDPNIFTRKAKGDRAAPAGKNPGTSGDTKVAAPPANMKEAISNQGKTGPIGLGSIKLGMLAKEIKTLPSLEAIRIDKWEDANEFGKYSCRLREKYDLEKDPNRPPCIDLEDWILNPQSYPAKVMVEVEMSNPFVDSLPGKLIFEKGILTSIELSLYRQSIFAWIGPAKVNLPHFKITGVSDYDSAILSDALHDEFKIMLTEKYGKIPPVIKSKKKLCGTDVYDETVTRYEWSDKNKLLGTVITSLTTEKGFSCASLYTDRPMEKVINITFKVELLKREDLPAVKNVF
jgi:hypothetical protein